MEEDTCWPIQLGWGGRTARGQGQVEMASGRGVGSRLCSRKMRLTRVYCLPHRLTATDLQRAGLVGHSGHQVGGRVAVSKRTALLGGWPEDPESQLLPRSAPHLGLILSRAQVVPVHIKAEKHSSREPGHEGEERQGTAGGQVSQGGRDIDPS